MLDFDTALELMKKYGYSSTVHPYIYQKGDTIGICYSYNDEDFGTLERIQLFEDTESFEEFLKKLDWVKTNGRNYHVRMALDNYESTNPKVIFLRKEKIMVEGEMFDIANYDYRESQREQMDAVSKVIYEAGDLLLVYDEIKGRQLQYLKSIVKLKNSLRQKYFDLQKEVDKYNKYKVERALVLLPEVADIGINEMLEINIKDRYNMYVAQRPSYEDAVDFLKEVWDLNKNLELNVKYYEAMKEENDVRNEIKVVDQKLELMRKLNDVYKPLFGVDLVGKFRKINKSCKAFSNSISSDIIVENINTINRKYSMFDRLDILYTSDYLREAIQNTNYADLAIKYSKDATVQEVGRAKLPLNEVAASLSVQYRDRLTMEEQAILVIYNNHKYRKLCHAILQIDNFDTLPVKKVISKINGIKGFSKIKSECFDVVKKRIDDPLNAKIKETLFQNYDFTSFETFIASLIQSLMRLRNVNNKMVLNGDINMYLIVDKVEDISKEKFLMVTNDLNSLLVETKGTNRMIGITLLKENSPVLYSPYYFDVGDIYSKNASLQMEIKEMVDFELLVETSDIVINVDPFRTNVVRYYSEPNAIDNVLVVDDLKMNYKTTFCKFAFTSNIPSVVVAENQESQAVFHVEEKPVVSNPTSVQAEVPAKEMTGNGSMTATPAVSPNVEVPASSAVVKTEKAIETPSVKDGSTGTVANDVTISKVEKPVEADKKEAVSSAVKENQPVLTKTVSKENVPIKAGESSVGHGIVKTETASAVNLKKDDSQSASKVKVEEKPSVVQEQKVGSVVTKEKVSNIQPAVSKEKVNPANVSNGNPPVKLASPVKATGVTAPSKTPVVSKGTLPVTKQVSYVTTPVSSTGSAMPSKPVAPVAKVVPDPSVTPVKKPAATPQGGQVVKNASLPKEAVPVQGKSAVSPTDAKVGEKPVVSSAQVTQKNSESKED